jgi:hypothetical protein
LRGRDRNTKIDLPNREETDGQRAVAEYLGSFLRSQEMGHGMI